jgi:hypothetical protein
MAPPSMRQPAWDGYAFMVIQGVFLGSGAVFPLCFRQYGYGDGQGVGYGDGVFLHASTHWQLWIGPVFVPFLCDIVEAPCRSWQAHSHI